VSQSQVTPPVPSSVGRAPVPHVKHCVRVQVAQLAKREHFLDDVFLCAGVACAAAKANANMASRALLVALVAMMLVASAAAQATPAHKNTSSKKCSRFANCATCTRTQCLTCGTGALPTDDGTGGVTCDCDTDDDYCNFSVRAWNAYARGTGKCRSSGHRGLLNSGKSKCPARPGLLQVRR